MTLQQKCLDRIEECYRIAEKHFQRSFPRPKVTFSNRMTTTAGWASPYENEIRLSNKLLQENSQVFVNDTPGHEAAHMIAFEKYGKGIQAHGNEWQSVMVLFGQEPSRLHKMKSGDELRYVVDGKEKFLSKIRHNKLQRGKVLAYNFKDGVRVEKHHYTD